MNDALAAKVSAWRDDPVLFVREALRVEEIEAWQVEGLNALVLHDRLAVRSGHGVGKTCWMSWIILWWLLTRTPAKIGCTATTAGQLEDALWPEIGIWHTRLPDALRGLLEIKASRVEMIPPPGVPVVSFAVAKTARPEKPEALQGLHAKHMLFLIDECSGVDDIIFETARGAMSTAGAKTVMTGNPTRASGYFFNAFHSMRHRWWTRKVGCAESNRADPAFIAEMAEDYGVDSNVYRVRVLGEFPTSDDDSVIPLHLVEAAAAREIDIPAVERIVWGVDVARFGSDRSALAKRSETRLIEPVKWWRGIDLMEVAGVIKVEYDTCHAWERPEAILVDAIGYGAGVADRLKEQGLPAKAVNVAELPAERELYSRLRDELWFNARAWFDNRACWIPNDSELIAELTMVGYQILSAGKIKVESKEEMKKRTSPRKSPDLADAFCLTFAKAGQRMRVRPGAPKRANSSYSPLNWKRRVA